MNILRPYPGEILYSWVVRMYALYTKGEECWLKEMFGMNRFGIYKVKRFNNTSIQKVFPIEEIIRYHSIASLLQVSMTKEQYKEMITNIDGEKFARYKWPIHPKICPKCHKEDIEKYGEPYLHVEHQLPENLVCHKHSVDLTIMKEGIVARKGIQLYILPRNNIKETSSYKNPFYFEVSKMISEIFNNGILQDIFQEQAYLKYQSKLREKGYYNETLMDKQTVKKDLLQYFGEDVLDNLGVSMSQDRGWLSSITQKQQAKLRLIHHLVMIKFLFGTIEKFVSYEAKDYEPFGKGPWPCLNPFCSLYKQNTISKVKTRKGHIDSYIVGVWECKTCGFVYTRQGPDPKNINQYKIATIRRYGKIFDEIVKEGRDDINQGLIELAKTVPYTKRKTLNKHLEKLGIDVAIYNKNMVYAGEKEEIEEYKKILLDRLKTRPNTTYEDIRKTHYYIRLRKLDPVFCDTQLPKPNVIRTGTKQFEERDRAIATEIMKIAEDILATNKAVRMTKHYFTSQIGYRGLEDKNMLDKMHLTKEVLEKYCESTQEYHNRLGKESKYIPTE